MSTYESRKIDQIAKGDIMEELEKLFNSNDYRASILYLSGTMNE